MKKSIALILTILMILCFFASCDNIPTEKVTENKIENQTESETAGNNNFTSECTHIDDILDHLCDKCGTSIVVHADKATDADHRCDYCNALMSLCDDLNKDHSCDECGLTLSEHWDKFGDGDHLCDYCQAIFTSCKDNYNNHLCDECGVPISEHLDTLGDGNHECDHCQAKLTSCEDTDKNHLCDECGAMIGEHSDKIGDGDHNCDYCQEKLTSCENNNNDHLCDECGASPIHNYKNLKCTFCGDEILYQRNGDKILFGSYPQSEVTESALITALNAMVGALPTDDNPQQWTTYGYRYYISHPIPDDFTQIELINYMWFIDLEKDGEMYRGVYFRAQQNSYQKDNGYIKENIYWFKYEPISWTILNRNSDNNTALIVSDDILFTLSYDASYETSNYEKSEIRRWLNADFYNTAFNELQKQLILITNVDNSVASTGDKYNDYVCEDTQDKIFLPSHSEVIVTKSITNHTVITGLKRPTGYAKVHGAYSSIEDDGNGDWWLRSPSGNDTVYIILSHTVKGRGSFSVDKNYIGVVPALQIQL